MTDVGRTARRTEIGCTYEGVDIAADLRPHLKGITYTDALSGESDDVQISLEDRDGLWAGAWRPQEGHTHRCYIEAPSDVAGRTIRRDCGLATVDEIDYSHPPSEIRIKAVSAGITQGLARTRRTRAWRESSLRAIAAEIATRAGLDLVFAAPDPGFRRRSRPRPAALPPTPPRTAAEQADLAGRYGDAILARATAAPRTFSGPTYERVDQRNETDLAFLLRLCGDYGLALKVFDQAIAIFLEADLEAAPPLATIRLGESAVIGYRVSRATSDTYASATVRYRDPRNGRVYSATHPSPRRNAEPEEPNLAVTARVESQAEAEQRAQDLLRARNARGHTGTITLAGDPAWYAGATADIEARVLSGRYLVTRVTHSTAGGYTTTLDVRRILDEDGRPE